MMMKMTTMKMTTSACLCLLSAVISMISMVNSSDDIIATCTMNSLQQPNKTVYGNITLRQSGNTTVITGLLNGFTWGGKHGFHIHQNGNLSNSCDAAGLHYNPFNTTHGPQDANITMRHVGDLGNIDVDANNMTANFTIVDSIIQLQGNYSVVGRALVVHSGTDDLGKGNSTNSNSTGDSGYKIGCCIIEINGNSTTTSAPVNGSSTTRGPAGSAVSVGPLAAVSAVCLAAAVQLIIISLG